MRTSYHYVLRTERTKHTIAKNNKSTWVTWLELEKTNVNVMNGKKRNSFLLRKKCAFFIYRHKAYMAEGTSVFSVVGVVAEQKHLPTIVPGVPWASPPPLG